MFFRAVIRFVSSLLHKMVDSLAPSVTNLLVRGKIVRIFICIVNMIYHLFSGNYRNFWS